MIASKGIRVALAAALIGVIGCRSGGCGQSPPLAPATLASAPPAPNGPSAPPVPPELVGRWRLERKDETTTRTSVYQFHASGELEIDTRLESPTLKTSDLVKAVVTKVDGDKLTYVARSHTSQEGVVDPIPVERQRPQTVAFRIEGDELHWTREDGADKANRRTSVLRRIKG